MLNNQPLNGPSNYKMNSHKELVSQKLEESNLWDYTKIYGVEVLELNGFIRFKLDGQVFFIKLSPVTLKKSSCSSKFLNNFI